MIGYLFLFTVITSHILALVTLNDKWNLEIYLVRKNQNNIICYVNFSSCELLLTLFKQNSRQVNAYWNVLIFNVVMLRYENCSNVGCFILSLNMSELILIGLIHVKNQPYNLSGKMTVIW